MKYLKTKQLYKGANVTFCPVTLDAYSYGWWRFVAKVEGKVIFNNYRYSVTTAKHQRQVRQIMHDLGIQIDMEMPLPKGIHHEDTLAELIETAEIEVCDAYLEAECKRQEQNERARERRAERKEMERQRLEQRPHLGLAGEVAK